MKVFEILLLLFLIVCAVATAFAKDLLTSIVIYMSYSMVMCIIWILLQSPDLAITEAAVGAGVTSILFFATLKKINAIRKEAQDEQEEKDYETSLFVKFKRWFDGDMDILGNGMETVALKEEPAAKEAVETEEVVKAREVSEEKGLRIYRKVYRVMSVLLCLGVISVLLWTVTYLPEFGNAGNPDNNEVSARYIEKGLEETGAVNMVTGMILDYRAFDTFGESCVLFIGSCCVMVLLKIDKKNKSEETKKRLKAAEDRGYEPKEDIILQKCAGILVPMLLVFGIYIVLNGHLSPGGGFSGGAVIGSGLILYASAFGFEKINRFFTEKTYRKITVSALTFYCLAKSYSFFTGANHLESGIPNGTPGNIISSGLILPLNICVGLVVACTMYAFYTLFRKGDL